MFKKLSIWISNISDFVKKSMSEDNGKPSMLRLNITNMGVQWVTAITFGYIWTVIKHSEYMLAYEGSLLTALLISFGIKKSAKKDEQKIDPNTISETEDVSDISNESISNSTDNAKVIQNK